MKHHSINQSMKVLTMMVNNPININKTNNHLSPQITEHKKGQDIYDVGNTGSGLRQGKQVVGLNRLTGSEPPLS